MESVDFIFSAKNNAFFMKSMLNSYLSKGWVIDDAIDVSDKDYEVYNSAPPTGKTLSSRDGMPCWIDIPPPPPDELIAEAEAKKIQLRATADAEIAWRQDAVDAGIATEAETAALAEWRRYRVLLMRVDTAAPVWPTAPAGQAK